MKIPFNGTKYDLILENQQNIWKKNAKNNEKCDLVLNAGMIGSQNAGKSLLSESYQDANSLSINFNFYESLFLIIFIKL